MNRILKRPMFRRGGSAGTGITSGLDTPKRGLVDGPGMYSQPASDDPYDRALKTTERFEGDIDRFVSRQPALGPGTLPGFLTSFGLDLASRTPTGTGFRGLLATAAGAAKGPFETFQAAQLTRGAEKSDLKKDIFTSALASEYDLEKERIEQAGEGTSDDRKTPEVEREIIKTAQQNIFNAEDILNKPGVTDQEKLDAQRTIQINQNVLQKELGIPVEFQAILSNETLFNENQDAYVLSYNQAQTAKQKEYLANNQDKTPMDALAEFPLMKAGTAQAINYTIQQLSERFKFRTTRADGGRIGYSMGSEEAVGSEPLMKELVETEKDTGSVQDLSFTELRARLPNEISNDIVQLLATSKKALLDFANIQTTEDISNFNKLYDVNLTLPQGA
jgi:hypothetical protein